MCKWAKCESAQNVRVHPMWMSPKCQCAQNVRVHPMWMCPKCLCAQCRCTQMSECAQCGSAQNVRVPAMWIHTHFLGGYFCAQIFRVHPRSMCQCWRIFWVVISTPNLSEWSHNVRVHPIWMHPKCQSVPDVNGPRMSGSAPCESAHNVRVPYQIWKSGHQIWKGRITHGQHEMAHCNALISNTTQQKYKCIGLILEKYTITWNSFVSG